MIVTCTDCRVERTDAPYDAPCPDCGSTVRAAVVLDPPIGACSVCGDLALVMIAGVVSCSTCAAVRA